MYSFDEKKVLRKHRAISRQCAACYGGGIGPALMDALSADDMSAEQLIKTAQLWEVDIGRFEI